MTVDVPSCPVLVLNYSTSVLVLVGYEGLSKKIVCKSDMSLHSNADLDLGARLERSAAWIVCFEESF